MMLPDLSLHPHPTAPWGHSRHSARSNSTSEPHEHQKKKSKPTLTVAFWNWADSCGRSRSLSLPLLLPSKTTAQHSNITSRHKKALSCSFLRLLVLLQFLSASDWRHWRLNNRGNPQNWPTPPCHQLLTKVFRPLLPPVMFTSALFTYVS